MSKRFKTTTLLPVILLAGTGTTTSAWAAGETLVLSQAINEARDKSPQVARARSAMEEADWAGTESVSGFLPKLNLTANYFLVQNFVVFDVTAFGPTPVQFPFVVPKSTVSLDASLPLFDGLQNFNHYRSAKMGAAAAREDFEWASFQLEEQIQLKFHQALAAIKLAYVAEQNLKTLTDHLERARILRRGGVATDYDVLRIEVQVSEAGSEKLSAEDAVVIARQRLAEAMGLEQDTRPIAGELAVPDRNLADLKLQADTIRRADLDAMAQRASAMVLNSDAAKAHWYPRLSLGANYQVYNDRPDSNLGFIDQFRSAYSLGLFLSWNLFDGISSYARQRQAAEKMKQAELAVESSRIKVPGDFEFWKRRYIYSSALFRARRSDVEKTEESVRLAKVGFRAGSRTNSDVLDAELDLFRARAGLVRAQLDASEAVVNLEMVIGKKLI